MAFLPPQPKVRGDILFTCKIPILRRRLTTSFPSVHAKAVHRSVGHARFSRVGRRDRVVGHEPVEGFGKRPSCRTSAPGDQRSEEA
jgi:hypothetical protein